ncbi:MAG: YbgC/FadM family acyl-CoA thioesterase [Pseudomonadota bacterium]
MNETDAYGKRPTADALLDGWMEDGAHHYRGRIYYADTDLSGAVYHARYLEMLERGRSDFLRVTGILHSSLEAQDKPVFWIVRRMEIDWLRGARIDDLFQVSTRVSDVKRARIFMAQEIRRGDEVLLKADVIAALIDQEGKPQRMPKEWMQAFSDLVSAPGDVQSS